MLREFGPERALSRADQGIIDLVTEAMATVSRVDSDEEVSSYRHGSLSSVELLSARSEDDRRLLAVYPVLYDAVQAVKERLEGELGAAEMVVPVSDRKDEL